MGPSLLPGPGCCWWWCSGGGGGSGDVLLLLWLLVVVEEGLEVEAPGTQLLVRALHHQHQPTVHPSARLACPPTRVSGMLLLCVPPLPTWSTSLQVPVAWSAAMTTTRST